MASFFQLNELAGDIEMSTEELYSRVNSLEVNQARVRQKIETHHDRYESDIDHIHGCIAGVRKEVSDERKEHKADMEKIHSRLNNLVLMFLSIAIGIVIQLGITLSR